MHPVHPRLVNQPLSNSQRHQARFAQAGQRAGLGFFCAFVGAPSRSAIEADSPATGGLGRAHHQQHFLN